MAKFYGPIGYVTSSETAQDVYQEIPIEIYYFGDELKNTKQPQSGENLNDDLKVNNVISIIADPYANQNFHAMRYIKWMGSAWKITNVQVQRPRLILTIGGVYNGIQVTTEPDIPGSSGIE